MIRIEQLDAWEVLDSRGRPTVAATMAVEPGVRVSISIPSGASTGKAEAQELRDGGRRFGGFGCRAAVASIVGPISAAIVGESFEDQEHLDTRLCALDGTRTKSRLGANAILAISLAFARAAAKVRRQELFDYFASLLPESPPALPQLSINLFSGGKHAFGQVAIQDLLVVPSKHSSIADQLAVVYDVYQNAAAIASKRYQSRALTADEGGLAPPFKASAEMFESAAEAVAAAGYQLGADVRLAVDVASSHFVQPDGTYQIDGETLRPSELIERIAKWAEAYSLVSVEDGLSEDDWNHWPDLRKRLNDRTLTLADDLTCTNPERIQRAIDLAAANALLLKVNQIGTVSEAKNACVLARTAGWKISVSARSGETEDDWLADLAVGWSGDFIKVGSITQSERLSKYNRLLAIEHEFESRFSHRQSKSASQNL